MTRINTCLVTYGGTINCEIEEEDAEKLNVKEPGTFITIYNGMNPETGKLRFHQKEIETSSIVAKLY